MGASHRLVIVGGGIAGIDLATRLAGRKTKRGQLMVTLIDQETAHVWKPMLHTVAAGTRDVYQQQTTYLAQAREHGFVFQPGEVVAVEQAAKKVHLARWHTPQGQELLADRYIQYDTLILAVGSCANDFGTPGITEHCFTIDSRSQALAVNQEARIQILHSVVADSPFRIGIVGGGATGVELAAELVQLAELSEYYGASGMAGKVKITLLETSDRLLAVFPERIAFAVRAQLERMGVIVQTGTKVISADAEGFHLSDGSLVACDLKVWAAGVKGPRVMSTLKGLQFTRNNQVIVGPNLQVVQDPDIYAVGDCSSLSLPGQERPLPPTAQVASQQARFLAKHLPALLARQPVPPFVYHDFGSLVSVGGYGAFGSLGKFGFFRGGFIRGRVAQLGHALLYRSHQARLHGFWRGSLLWLVDWINARVRPSIRLD